MKNISKKIIICLVLSALIMAAFGMGLFSKTDNRLADSMYQSSQALDGNVVVIGIDGQALEEYGVWPWDRSVIAQTIATLNADEETRPAAIGIDVIFTSESNPKSDAALVDAVSADNVVVAASASFSDTLSGDSEDGVGYIDRYAVSSWNLPFDELSQAGHVGHINAMYDRDGILRHHIWSVGGNESDAPADAADTGLMSMPWQLYNLYCNYWGYEADFAPVMDNDKGFWYVTFGGEPGDYYQFSVSDILNGSYDPDLLAGAVVLIGPYDAGLSDSVITSINHAHEMYGVEFMANVTDNMIRGESAHSASNALQLLALFIVCMAGGMCFFCLRFRWAVPIYVVGAGGSLGICKLAFSSAGLVLHPMWIPAGLTLLLVVGIAFNYLTEAREKSHITKVFSRYVDPGIISELLKVDSDALGLNGKLVDIAVLFVDIRGFTTMSEALQPTEVVAILDDYLTLTSECVKKNGGTLDKFVGDCTMAFWGAPLPCDDAVYKACRAALDMAEGSRPLAEKLQEKYGRAVAFGIGVHFGPAVVGNIGSPDRMDYTAIGDTVNTASRLESNAPAETVYISRIVADMLGERAETTSLGGAIKLKGKTEGFEVLVLDKLK